MAMHKVENSFKLTGSKLFDMVLYNEATKLCTKYPGLHFEYTKTEILITGEIEDLLYEQYQAEVLG